MTAPGLDPDLLRAFTAVAQQRSFTRAAGVLHRTQSAVSLQIKRLETLLGVSLFERRAQGVELTSAGRTLLGFAERMLTLSGQAVAAVAARPSAAAVRLGVMEDFGIRVAAPLVAEFTAAHPGSSVDLRTGLTGPMVDRLEHDFDLVIAMHPTGERRGHLLRRERPVWAVGPRFLAPATAASPLPLALYVPGCLLREWALRALDSAGRPWALTFVGQNIATVHAAAAEGQGLTVVKSGLFPRSLRKAPAALGLPRLPGAEVRLHCAPGLSRTGRALADHLQARAGPTRDPGSCW